MTAPYTADGIGPRVRATGGGTWRGSTLPTQVLVLTARSLRPLLSDPRVVLFGALGPLLVLLIFSQIFAGISHAPGFPAGVAYIDFLVPAIMMTTALQSALNTAAGLVLEMRSGIVSRFRALPIWPGSVLLARSLADLTRNALHLVLLLTFAYALVGFRPAGGLAGVLAAGGLAVTVGGCLGWIFIALACYVRNTELMQGVVGLVLLPCMFASNAFVPTAGLPGWLRVLARLNPVTYGINAARNFILARPAGGGAVTAVAISLTIAVAASVVAVRGFQRPT